MNETLVFPDPMEVARERGEEFQRLSSDERVLAMIDTIETGLFLISNSPHREAIDRLFLEREREWQEIQQRLFAQHGV